MFNRLNQPTTLCLLFVAPASLGAEVSRTMPFVWEDINTREVMRWEGDTAIVKAGTSMEEFECKIKIDQKKVDFAIESFGIPETWTTINYSDEKELATKQKALNEKVKNHGIKMMEGDDQFIVDYGWVVQKSENDLIEIAETIQSTARKRGYRTKRELLGAFASFSQSLRYRIPPNHRINDDGEKILTAGAFMPIETLSKGWGDCDSKSLLFAGLVRSIDLAEVCFIVMDDHLFAGVRIRPEQDDHYIKHRGREWVLIELSDAWPIGRIPIDHQNGITKNKYEVVDIP